MANTNNEGKIKRYVHSPIAIEHHGIQASIHANGKLTLTKVARVVGGEEVEFDEVEIPASLIFKLATLLRATRKIVYVGLNEVDKTAPASED